MLPGLIARARVRSLVNCREFGSGGQIAIVVRVPSLDELSRGGKTTVHDDLETDEQFFFIFIFLPFFPFFSREFRSFARKGEKDEGNVDELRMSICRRESGRSKDLCFDRQQSSSR